MWIMCLFNEINWLGWNVKRYERIILRDDLYNLLAKWIFFSFSPASSSSLFFIFVSRFNIISGLCSNLLWEENVKALNTKKKKLRKKLFKKQRKYYVHGKFLREWKKTKTRQIKSTRRVELFTLTKWLEKIFRINSMKTRNIYKQKLFI